VTAAQRWVLIDGAARDELGDEFHLTPLGEEMFKGKSELVRVFAVDAELSVSTL
jgi:class 3 adenylate cyclase